MTNSRAQEPDAAGSPTRTGASSLAVKLTFVLLLVSLLPMTAITLYNLQGSLSTVLDAKERNLKLLATNVAERLDQLVLDTHKIVSFLSTDPDVIGLLSTSGEQREAHLRAAQGVLQRVFDASGDFAAVFVLDRQNEIIASADKRDIGSTGPYYLYRKAAQHGEHYVSGLVLRSSADRTSTGVFFAGPVYDGAAIVGVAVVMLPGSAVDTVLAYVERVSGEIDVFLVNDGGIVVADPDIKVVEGIQAAAPTASTRGWLYRSLGPLSPQNIEQIQQRDGFPVDRIDCLCIPELAEALVNPASAGTRSYRAPDSGEPHIVGYAPLEDSGMWTVVVDEPRAVFAVPIERLAHHGLISVAVVGVGVLLLAVALGRRLVRPLIALTESVVTLKSCAEVDAGEPPGAPAAPGPLTLPERFRLDERSKVELASIAATHRDEIGKLARTFEDMVGRLQDYIEDLKRVTAANERIESEMKLAGDIQLSFLVTDFSAPNARPELDLYAFVHPAKHAGGDLYDFLFVDDEHLFFVIGDVSDKGMPAALFMAVTLTLIRNLVRRDVPPDRVLSDVNRVLCYKNDAYQFVTLFCGLLHLPTGQVHYSHGGHNPPYLVSPSTGGLRSLEPVSGVALGAIEGAIYKTETLTMAPGDVLFTYSDGITEAMDSKHELFGEPRLEASLRRLGPSESAAATAEAVLTEVKGFVGEAPQSDDITALCIRFLGDAGGP